MWALWEQHWSGRCAIRTVKLSNAEACETEAISEQARGAYQAGLRVAKLQAVVEPASAVALQGSFVLVLGIGGARLASDAITLGDLVAFCCTCCTCLSRSCWSSRPSRTSSKAWPRAPA